MFQLQKQGKGKPLSIYKYGRPGLLLAQSSCYLHLTGPVNGAGWARV